MEYELFIIDAISPFFIKHPKTAINWSKIPFDHIEKNGSFRKKRYLKIKRDFQTYIDQVAAIGYNAISIDDLCHLAVLDLYNPELQNKLKKYQKRYRKLFKYVKSKNMKVFVTTDLMFFNDEIRAYTGSDLKKIIHIMRETIRHVFQQVPEVDGIIFRMGESDGVDVSGDFISDIVISTPGQASAFILDILPLFVQYNKLMIFRTWTIGINKIGDLIWNPTTYQQTFAQINSDHFIISLKHGEGDFFRYLDINRHFIEDKKHHKILEVQTRREYEGFGEFPNFVGWEYEKIARRLEQCDTLIGISVWCQTGGWSSSRNFSYLKNSSFFIELNTYVVLRIFKQQQTVEQSIAEFCPQLPQDKLLKFLHLSEQVINELLYEPHFARHSLYFNRIRIPPLLYIFWHYVSLTTPMIEIFKYYTDDPETAVNEAEKAFKKISQIKKLNQKLKLDYDHQYYSDTFELILICRKLIYSNNQEDFQDFLQKKETYHTRYPHGYEYFVKLPPPDSSRLLGKLIPLFIRSQADYRIVDRLLFNALSSKFYIWLSRRFTDELPDFVDNKAMPLEKFLQ